MTTQTTYHANRVRIDDLLRQAAEQRIAKEAKLRPDASPPKLLGQPQPRVARLRRALRDLNPRPTTR
jgi:hypothetical protein